MKYSKNTIWKVIRNFSNLNASISLLLTIASISIIGTIIEQDQSIDYYKSNYPINNYHLPFTLTWGFIKFWGLDHIYRTWWFLLLLVLFIFTLVACTFSRQLPSLRNARNWKFSKYNEQRRHEQNFTFPEITLLSNIVYELNLKYYYVFHKNNNLYAYKGLIGRIAPIIVHISIIIILFGSMLGLFSGFTSQQVITKGEIFHIQNIIRSGASSYLPNNIIGKVNDFKIEYYPDESIKQFFSHVCLLDKQGRTIKEQLVSVNHPFIFKGVTFYQTDWRISALRIRVNNSYNIQQPLEKVQFGNTSLWIYRMPININKYISVIIVNTTNSILLYNEFGEFINSVSINESFTINNNNIEFQELMTQTGIQIKSDPGIAYVYAGFLALIISIITSYQSYYQIWIYENYQNLQIIGKTNRGKLSFEEEILKIQKCIIKYA